ncbi:hypothetical protein Z517_01322 [Fonsecaea pedrosoi CBS 271.37]|uniref:Unplaced genomic scaffold supercont1.1, whole genome shotgun sequence n=1 Tax=Fonsecaea pedrosoi CBS 271.37 TaxID=1442368 RepID=A0A0D2HNB5_9EURO|nr:uncharacterized protein Z517_01322 [Fonsecaea pedrosoi CBS 271.37]KIW85929.1 hypothetical protein Z517_01322 [Fonsecaea pedrosoi CBS 271.37]
MSETAMEPSTKHSKNPPENRDVASQTYLSLPQSNSDPAKIKAPLIQSMRYSPYPRPTFIAAVRQKTSSALKQALQWHQIRIQNWLAPKQSTQKIMDVDSEIMTVEVDSLSSMLGSDVKLTTPEIDRQTQVSEESEYEDRLFSQQADFIRLRDAKLLMITAPSPQARGNGKHADLGSSTVSIPAALSTSLIPDGSREDNKLFHHYISNVSVMMTPFNDDYNPWKSTYPCLAVHDVTSNSTGSLFHGILAQSAFHLSNLNGPNPASYRRLATQHFGIALRHLRCSLGRPTEDISSTLAAILTVQFDTSRSFLRQKPWVTSDEAWVITQSFVLHTLMSQIVGGDTPSTDRTLHEVLEDVTADPRFAYTLGSTPRLMNALYEARLLEGQLAVRGASRSGRQPDLSEDELAQASSILVALDAEVELYMSRQRAVQDRAEQRKFIVSNLYLFNSAVTIYLLCVVLHHPPSAVTDQVSQTLSAAASLLEMNRAAVSIWSIFVAAAEAYTTEAQTLADGVLSLSTGFGVANRALIHQVVKRIWSEREEVAARRGCDAGIVFVNWREVLRNLDVEILLL